MRELYAHEENSERFFVLGEEDIRGVDMLEGVYTEPWSPVSQASIAIKLVGYEGEVSLTLRRKSSDAFVEDFCGGDFNYLAHFQFIYVWRCPCNLQTRIEWSKLAELPNEPGFYGACPGCGSIALEIME